LVRRLLVRISEDSIGSCCSRFLPTRAILLLLSSSVCRRVSGGNPSSFTTSLSERSMASNWFCVAPRFSIAPILFPVSFVGLRFGHDDDVSRGFMQAGACKATVHRHVRVARAHTEVARSKPRGNIGEIIWGRAAGPDGFFGFFCEWNRPPLSLFFSDGDQSSLPARTSEIELVLLARIEPLLAAHDELRRQPPREPRQAAEHVLLIRLERIHSHGSRVIFFSPLR
jgi:hypothetical protein